MKCEEKDRLASDEIVDLLSERRVHQLRTNQMGVAACVRAAMRYLNSDALKARESEGSRQLDESRVWFLMPQL